MSPYDLPEEYVSTNSKLSSAIARRLKRLSQEENFPNGSADDSEAKIRRLRDDIAELRNIRERLEHIFYS